MKTPKVKEIFDQVRRMAKMVLPDHTTVAPEMQIVCMMGAIPDTYEWFSMKTGCLCLDEDIMEPEDFELVIEWQDYIIQKAKKFLAQKGIDVNRLEGSV